MQDKWQGIVDALAGLEGAVQGAADALGELNSASDGGSSGDADGANALVALFTLNDALTNTRDLAAKALPRLLAAARPGPSESQTARDLTDKLSAAAERVASERAALEKLMAQEGELRRRAAECEKLRAEAAELRRLQGLAAELDALRAQREVVDARLQELRGRDLGAVDRELHDGARDLLQLTEKQLAVLELETRQTLELAAQRLAELEAMERELSKVDRELADRQDQLAHIQEKYGPVSASLARHAKADRQLAQALREAAGVDPSGPAPMEDLTPANVEQLLGTIEDRLKKADEILRDVLSEPQDPDGGTRITGDQT